MLFPSAVVLSRLRLPTMSNSVDNSPLGSPTAAAAATPPPMATTFWCDGCLSFRSIGPPVSSPHLTCPYCGTDPLEQIELHTHDRARPPRQPASLLPPFDDLDNHDDEFGILFEPLPPPALLSYSTSDDDRDYDGFDPHLDDYDDRDGRPSPAPKSSIDAIPDVKITADFLGSDKDSCVLCAVCTDELTIGSEAKQLPCSHVYHGDCIVPWLSLCNSCPVCRSRLPISWEDGRRKQRNGGARSVPILRFGNSLEEEGGLDELETVAAPGNWIWLPMLSQPATVAAANDRRTVLSRWETQTEGYLGIDDGMHNDGEGVRPVALVE